MSRVRNQIHIVLWRMSQLQIIKTEDGSPSLWNPDLGETYHSRYGAVQESLHVFIKSGLNAFIPEKSELSILEIGLGTGLNAALTATRIGEMRVAYTGLEPFPVDLELLEQMKFGEALAVEEFNFLTAIWAAPFEDALEIGQDFTLTKSKSGIADFDSSGREFHLIYFDAFAPEIQSELWEPAVFRKIFKMTSIGGILVTYCAKGQVRRDLIEAGFQVEKLEGPPGKRHMLRATKP